MTEWSPCSDPERQVAAAIAHAKLDAVSFDDAINKLVNVYYGFHAAYDASVQEKTSLIGKLSTTEAEREGYRSSYDVIVEERGDLIRALSSLEAERDGYRQSYEAVTERLNELQLKLNTLEVDVAGYRNAYETIRTDLGQVRSVAPKSFGQAFGHPLSPRQPTERSQAPSQTAPEAPSGSTPETLMATTFAFEKLVAEGQALERAGDRDAAISAYIGAQKALFGYGPAVEATDRLGRELFVEAIGLRDAGHRDAALELLVRSIEIAPRSDEARRTLQALLDERPGRDLTQECLIFPDAARASHFYRSAIQTCLDFAAFGGVTGDILEFGVLGGWTARHFAELSRDMGFHADLHLFDSFEGLPLDKGAIDRASYDVVRGVWREEMHLPEAWEHEFGSTIDQHIVGKLAQVISPSRLKIRRGFYSSSLQQPIVAKAAIVHLDCDLYQSTVEVLTALERDDVLQDGTVMMFDDWNCNRANPAYGQRRAFREFLERNRGAWTASHYLNYGFNCAAFILHADVA